MIKLKKQYFTMIEIIATLAVLAILFSAFAAAINSVYRANKTFISESKAVLVLDNVIERLKGRKNVSTEEIKRVLLNEFQRSDLGKGKQHLAAGVKRDGNLVISISRVKDKRLLAEVKL
ncbi:MAG: type II secretion system protein [Victivallaceae bacterium]|nr:type II secretion system protein [Victivallaceae bacterium]